MRATHTWLTIMWTGPKNNEQPLYCAGAGTRQRARKVRGTWLINNRGSKVTVEKVKITGKNN